MTLFLEKCAGKNLYIVYVSDGPIISGLNWLIGEEDKNKNKTKKTENK